MRALMLTACLGLGLTGMAHGQEVDWTPFESYLAEFRVDRQIPSLSVLVLRDGEIEAEAYLGWSDDEGDHATTEETSYFIASVTKPIAGTSLFLAEQAGELDLDMPLGMAEDWQGFCAWFPNSPIIFAGGVVDDGTIVPDFECQGQTLRQALNMQVNGEPGSGFLYNPLVYARISRALDEVHSEDFRSLLYRHVLDPAGMTQTAAGWRDHARGHVLSRLAPPFFNDQDGLVKQPLPDDDLRAAAGLYMSARELARFDRAIDGDLLSERQREAMWTPPLQADGSDSVYSNGWYVQWYQGERLIWHSGWQPQAYSAIYLKLPERGLTLIALANTEALRWGNPLDAATIERSELVQAFLEAAIPTE